MLKRRLITSLLTLCMAASAFSAEGIPGRIGPWRIEVGPPGNEFYKAPKAGPPSKTVLRWVKIFAPRAEFTQWEFDDDGYYIICARLGEDEEYRFGVAPGGALLGLEYENDATDVDEEPDELVFRGTKKSIAVSDVPKAALNTLAEAVPGARPGKAWTADTIAGPRYVILIGKMAFYARPDGQIQAGGRLKDGALDEIDPPRTPKDSDPKRFNAGLKKLLGRYRDRFNFENQIKKLGKGPAGANGSFRYIVMGDSRSQWKLWSNVVKHIDSLNPKPAFVLNTGDVVPKGYAREYNTYYIRPLLETDIPFFIAIGNHDDSDDSMAREYRYLFGEEALNYHFDYGKARYVLLDNATDVQPYRETLKWLEKTLADTPKGYRKYVCAHKPPKNIAKWAYHAWDGSYSRAFTDLMTKFKVDEVYHGHIHGYSTAHYNGVDYTISGGGGAGLHSRYGPLGNVHHYVICDVTADGTVKQQIVRLHEAK
jgi:3',5'-cyclic AMP phosphodiesterase CpdA